MKDFLSCIYVCVCVVKVHRFYETPELVILVLQSIYTYFT
jgi:hypothetical protein